MRQQPLGMISAVVLLAFIAIAVFAPVIAPMDPYKIAVSERMQPPSSKHILGTDATGRDLASRVVYGTRVSLFVGVISVAVGTFFGTVWGLSSGYLGGKYDLVSQRLLDALMAFPPLILAMTLAIVLGASVQNVIIAIAVTRIPTAARVVRATAMSTKENVYVDAAVAMGCSTLRILAKHIAPNTLAPFLIVLSVNLGVAVVLEASLSFLGAGIPGPTPTWGQILGGVAGRMMFVPWWIVLFPGVAIFVLVLAFNLFGDTIRDLADPRLRSA